VGGIILFAIIVTMLLGLPVLNYHHTEIRKKDDSNGYR